VLLATALLAAGSMTLAPASDLHALFGDAALLVPLWLVWAALIALPRPRLPRPGWQLLTGAALLSACLPMLLSLSGAGGTFGQAALGALEVWLGRGGALSLLAIATCSGPLLMLGKRRGPLAAWIARAIERQATAGQTAGVRGRPVRMAARGDAAPRRVGDAAPAALAPGPRSEKMAPPRSSERELVILGPGGEPLKERSRQTSRNAVPRPASAAAAATSTPAHLVDARATRAAPAAIGQVPETQPAASTTVAVDDPAPDSSASAAATRQRGAVSPSLPAWPVTREAAQAAALPSSVSRHAQPTVRHQPSDPGQWQLPSTDLLSSSKQAAISATDLKAQARVIEDTLETFRLPVKVVEVRQGPAVSQFGLEPAPGVAVDRVAARSHDLALRLGARSIRIQAPIPGRTLIGVEVPNGETSVVSLRETLENASNKDQALPVALGKDVSGQPVVVDLARLPHLLIAGATGSGKSVGLNVLLMSLQLSRSPDEVQLILVDPKRVEMTAYTGIPHLRMPVLTEMELVLGALRWALEELESRFTRFASATCRNIEAYNQRYGGTQRIPRLVIVIDELADLMMTVPDEVERCLCRLAQLGRAAGIHLVVATQRPSVDVLTGLIKANFPARVSFAVSSLTDSRVILDAAGAEQLLGRGDMLFQAPDAAKPRRVQGAYVEERELRQVVSHWRRQGGPRFRPEEEAQLHTLGRQALADPDDKLLERARELADEHDNVTASFLQRKLGIGYPKAARLMQRLKEDEDEEEDLR
jgi:S-DNA-T family DNA segregation ATPase FtsK/SpoIIIE